MSELRDLLRPMKGFWNERHPLYPFLEALLNELEAQRPPEVDARIAKLTDERDSWERQCRNAERGLAEAKAETERLRARNKHLSGEMSRLNEVICAQNADAEIGWLVRGMPRGAGLIHTGPFSSESHDWVSWVRDGTRRGSSDDPAEALRSIQASE